MTAPSEEDDQLKEYDELPSAPPLKFRAQRCILDMFFVRAYNMATIRNSLLQTFDEKYLEFL
jgi:hypothetical protein